MKKRFLAFYIAKSNGAESWEWQFLLDEVITSFGFIESIVDQSIYLIEN